MYDSKTIVLCNINTFQTFFFFNLHHRLDVYIVPHTVETRDTYMFYFETLVF